MSPWPITSSTRQPANTEPTARELRSATASAAAGLAAVAAVRRWPARGRRCRGRRRPRRTPARAGGGGGAAAAHGRRRRHGRRLGSAGSGPPRRVGARTSVTSSVVEPTRTESPTCSARRPRTRSPLTNVPFADPRSSIGQLAACVAGNAGVAAGQLEIVAQPPLAAHCAPDHELVRRGRAAGPRAAPAVITSTSPRRRSRSARAPAAGAPAEARRRTSAGAALGAVRSTSRTVWPTRTTSPRVERPRGVDPLVVDERSVRRPEILDRQPAVGAARDAGVAARDLGDRRRAAPRPRAPGGRSAGRRRHSGSLPRSLPSVTRSCSPAIGFEA